MAKITCQKCQNSFETKNLDAAHHADGQSMESLVCPQCGFDNRKAPLPLPNLPVQTGQPEPAETDAVNPATIVGGRQTCVWEASWKQDFFNAYVETVKRVITNPVNYFATIKPFQDYLSLAVFVYINCAIAITANFFTQILFSSIFKGLGSAVMGLPGFLCGILFGPLVAVGLFFLFGFILHLFFTLIGGSKKGFETTMTVYGLGTATSLFGIVPVVGGLVGLVYHFIINIGGQARAHEISGGKAATSVLLPAAVCCCLVFVIGLVALVAAGGLAGLFPGFKGI